MAKSIEKKIEELQKMSIADLRKEAKSVGLKNYLKSSEEDLIERITEMYELEDEDDGIDVENEAEEAAKEDMASETEDEEEEEVEEEEEDESEESSDEEESDEEPEPSKEVKEEKPKKKSKPSSKKEQKKSEKKSSSSKKASAGKDKSIASRGDTKSDRVRAIVRELEERGAEYTSGKVILLLKERHGEDIHRSFCSSLIRQEKKKIAEEE